MSITVSASRDLAAGVSRRRIGGDMDASACARYTREHFFSRHGDELDRRAGEARYAARREFIVCEER